MAIQATLISMSNNKKRAMVTVILGEGAKNRHATRHIGWHDGAWWGFNPDERAVPLNRRYTAELLAAKADLASEEARLTQLREKLDELEAETPEDIMAVEMRKEMRAELEEAIKESQALVSFAQASFEDAELKLHIVQRELPLDVEFTF